MLTPCTLELEIPLAVRGMAVPVFHSSDLIPYETRVLDPEGMLPEVAKEDKPGCDDGGGGSAVYGPGGGSVGGGMGKWKRGKRRARSEDPGEPPPPPDEGAVEDEGATGDDPTVRDKDTGDGVAARHGRGRRTCISWRTTQRRCTGIRCGLR